MRVYVLKGKEWRTDFDWSETAWTLTERAEGEDPNEVGQRFGLSSSEAKQWAEAEIGQEVEWTSGNGLVASLTFTATVPDPWDDSGN